MIRRLFGRYGDNRQIEMLSYYCRDLAKRNALVTDTVISPSGGSFLDREPEEMRRVEAVHRRPTVESITDVRGNTLLARNTRSGGNESVIVFVMNRWRKSHCRGADAANNRCERRLFGLTRPPRCQTRIGLVFFCHHAPRRDESRAGCHDQRTLRSREHFSERLDRANVCLGGRFIIAKSWMNAVWMTPSQVAAPLRKLSGSSSAPRYTSAPAASTDAAAASERARPSTRWPVPTSSATMAEPMKPLAPVTKIRIAVVLSWRLPQFHRVALRIVDTGKLSRFRCIPVRIGRDRYIGAAECR